MVKINKILVVALFIIAGVISTEAREVSKVGQTGLQFLKIDIGARAAGMGGAYSMVGKGAGAIFHNPAGISESDNSFDIAINQNQWIAGITYNSITVIKNLERYGTIGISGISSDYGTIEGTRVADNEAGFIETGNVEVGAYAVGLSYARELTDNFKVGGHVKYAHQHLGSNIYKEGGESRKNVESGLVYDFGTRFYTGFKSHAIGITIQNFSTQWKYEEITFDLPLTFTLGTSINVMDFVEGHDNPLMLSIDAIHPRGFNEQIQVGSEYLFRDLVAFRAGYKFNYSEQGLSVGLGVRPRVSGVNMMIDYSYNDFGVFNGVHRFSVGIGY